MKIMKMKNKTLQTHLVWVLANFLFRCEHLQMFYRHTIIKDELVRPTLEYWSKLACMLDFLMVVLPFCSNLLDKRNVNIENQTRKFYENKESYCYSTDKLLTIKFEQQKILTDFQQIDRVTVKRLGTSKAISQLRVAFCWLLLTLKWSEIISQIY